MANSANEKVKRRYYQWLRGAKGFSEQSIVAIERALHQFEVSMDFKDFKTFSERQATSFKKWLDSRRVRGQPLSNTTKYHTLRHLSAFLSWLATQSGYKSRISLDAVSYLTLDRRTVREVLSPRPIQYPSLEQVKQLVASIEGSGEVDRRDRALISFMLLTGTRYRAICSLSLGCFDPDQLVVYQDPRKGVKTKGGKLITTWVLHFDDDLVNEIVSWVNYLKQERRFGPSDPLFPRTRVRQASDGPTFESDGIEAVFWEGGSSIRKILHKRAESAGLPYFQPHSFRHAACQLALKWAKTPEQLKALSQNFGHEQLTTTLRSYGNLDEDRVADIISGMSFAPSETNPTDTISINELREFLREKNKPLDL